MTQPRIEISEQEENGVRHVSFIISGAKWITRDGEPALSAKLTPTLAREMAVALEECAARVESH